MLFNRTNLNLIFSVFLLAILIVMIKFFSSIMGIDDVSKNHHVADTLLISNIGKQEIVAHPDWPVLVLRQAGNQFVVWDLKPRFSNDTEPVCMITVFEDEYSSEDGARFSDLCTGTRYSSSGRVLEPSPPFALSMRKLDWSVEGSYLVIETR